MSCNVIDASSFLHNIFEPTQYNRGTTTIYNPGNKLLSEPDVTETDQISHL